MRYPGPRTPDDRPESDSLFADFFVPEGYADLLRDFRIGIVVPQQSLRKSIQKVFEKTPGLGRHDRADAVRGRRLGRRLRPPRRRRDPPAQPARQPADRSPEQEVSGRTISRLFGDDDLSKTQLDWIRSKSRHQVFLLDEAQSVRPADLPAHVLDPLVREAKMASRRYPLASQMRVARGADYVDYMRRILRGEATEPRNFPGYDLRVFDDLGEMHEAIRARDRDHGLARLVAGFAWPWRSRKDSTKFDIELDGVALRWNSKAVDWINSPGSIDEVGSIHTVQGYDLNYAGVIIGHDLRLDPTTGRVHADRARTTTRKARRTTRHSASSTTTMTCSQFIVNIYAVLLTRGMRGTYVYACDPGLRMYLQQLLPPWTEHRVGCGGAGLKCRISRLALVDAPVPARR